MFLTKSCFTTPHRMLFQSNIHPTSLPYHDGVRARIATKHCLRTFDLTRNWRMTRWIQRQVFVTRITSISWQLPMKPPLARPRRPPPVNRDRGETRFLQRRWRKDISKRSSRRNLDLEWVQMAAFTYARFAFLSLFLWNHKLRIRSTSWTEIFWVSNNLIHSGNI